MRPFDFMVPFWGRRYREYWVDLSLPSLLATNNLPLLDVADGHRFLIATTEEDWHAICDLPIMARLRRYAVPVWIKIDLLPEGEDASGYDAYTNSVRLQNKAQKALVSAAGARRCYGSLLFPDVLYSDGFVAALLRLAREGYQGALLPAMRQIEEDVLSELTARGYLPAGEKSSLTSRPLHVPQRVMADLAVRHLHPEMILYDQTRPTQRFIIPFRYWRLNGGLVLHSFYGCLPFIDYAAMPEDHAACLEQGVLENVYASRNFSRFTRVHVVADSDEFAVVSLTPREVNWSPPDDFAPLARWFPGVARLVNIRHSMQAYAGVCQDAVRRNLFLTPVRWHRDNLDVHWRRNETRIAQTLDRAIGDYIVAARRSEFPSGPNAFDRVESVFFITIGRVKSAYAYFHFIGWHLYRSLVGKSDSRRWVGWALRKRAAILARRPFDEPRPQIPVPE